MVKVKTNLSKATSRLGHFVDTVSGTAHPFYTLPPSLIDSVLLHLLRERLVPWIDNL